MCWQKAETVEQKLCTETDLGLNSDLSFSSCTTLAKLLSLISFSFTNYKGKASKKHLIEL